MSGNASRTRGRKLELRWLAWLRLQGRWAMRIDGGADIITALAAERPKLQQVKGTAHPYDTFGPHERERLRLEARLAGFECELVWCPKGRRLSNAQVIPEAEWPS